MHENKAGCIFCTFRSLSYYLLGGMDMSKLDDRFYRVYEQIFLPTKKKGIRKFNQDGLTQQNISLLITWPGIIACKFGATINEENMVEGLINLKPLKQNAENNNYAVNDLTIHKEFTEAQQEQNKEISILIANIIEKNKFLYMISSAHFDGSDGDIEELIRLLSDYCLIIYLLIEHIKTGAKIFLISSDGIEETLLQYCQNNLIHYHLTCVSLHWLSMIEEPFQHFFKDIFEDELDMSDIDHFTEFLCFQLFDLYNEVSNLYLQIIKKFKNIINDSPEITFEYSNTFKSIMKNIQSNRTLFDIFLQYKQYYTCLYNMMSESNSTFIKEIIDDIEKAGKKFIKKELTEEMRLSLIKAGRELLNFAIILRHKEKLLQSGKFKNNVSFTIFNIKQCEHIDDESIAKYFTKQNNRNMFKYLKYLTPKELLYKNKNEDKDGSEDGNQLFLIEKHWKRENLERILPIIKSRIECNPFGFQMSKTQIVRNEIGEDKITDGLLQIEENFEDNAQDYDTIIYSNLFLKASWFDTSSDYKLPSKHSNDDNNHTGH